MSYDFAIIGGGVVGACIFNKLVATGNRNVVLLDAGSDVATGASKANSGLVHAGFDCKPNTLKAKLNVRGNFLYEGLTNRLKVPFFRCGAIVAGGNLDMVKELYNRGKQNNVKGLKILKTNKAIRKLNPNINEDVSCALYAKTAGLVSPYMFTIALCEEAIINGGTVKLNFEVHSCKKVKNEYVLTSKNKESVSAKIIINAAGAGYNKVAKILKTEEKPIKLVRGEYFLLDSDTISLSNLTIFPLPTAVGKGVLITPTIDGNILVGPTAIDGDETTPTTQEGLLAIRNKAAMLIKDIPFKKSIRQFAGNRVISGDDFIIERSNLNKDVINICGICSPGLSCAPAIAEMVVCDILGIKNVEIPLQARTEIISIKNKSKKELDALIKSNADYGQIVCKCELVSKKEVLDAINSPLKPISFDAIKRRVRVGMGKCQSGFCLLKVIDMIAKENNIDVTDVLKENAGSNIIDGNIDSTKNFVKAKETKTTKTKTRVQTKNAVKLETVSSITSSKKRGKAE